MSALIENELYCEDLAKIASMYDFSSLDGKTIMLSGATGMIGSFLVDLIMYLDEQCSHTIRVIALGRNWSKAERRFSSYFTSPILHIS